MVFRDFFSTGPTVSTTTDSKGLANVTVVQSVPSGGDNTIRIDVLSASGAALFSQNVVKTWLAPTLNITKSGPSTAAIGSNFDYTITVRNDSQATASSVTIVDQIPDGLAFVSSSPTGTVSGSTITWNLGTLAANSSASIVATFKATKAGN